MAEQNFQETFRKLSFQGPGGFLDLEVEKGLEQAEREGAV